METKLLRPGDALAALSNDLSAAVERASASVVAVHARPRTPSSGIHWRQGVVVTANHTVKREEEVACTLPDGRRVPATLAGRDPGTDLAVLKFEAGVTPTAEAGDASQLKVGNLVVAVGRREDLASGPPASLGIVSATGGPWHTWQGGQVDRLVRLDLSIFLGFSGGPLVNAEGRVVGMNTTGLWRNTGVAVPNSTIERVAEELLTKGRVARPYLGVGMQPVRLPEALVRKLNLPNASGLIVVTVEAGGPAEKAGVLIGDILVAFEARPVNDISHVQAVLSTERVENTLKASFVRGGSAVELAIRLAERPTGNS